MVDVQDTGRGIDQSDHERIFEAYEKVDEHTIEAGLGLTLARRFASLLNGSISLVSSRAGMGSHFKAIFPEPICACLLHQSQPLQKRFPLLPSTFHVPGPRSEAPSFSHQFGSYLEKHGYVTSESPQGSLMVLDHANDLAQLHRQTLQCGPTQVAICPINSSTRDISLDGEHVRREENVVYVEEPFLSSTFEEALGQANSILTEFASAKPSTRSLFPTIKPVVNISAMPLAHIPSKNLLQLGSDRPITVQTDLEQSLGDLSIATMSQNLPILSTMQSTKPMTLLVDDNSINLRLLQMYCNRRNIPYRTATDGQQAVRIFEDHYSLSTASQDINGVESQLPSQQPFQLVLMDLQMPVCDGIDATSQIRKLECKQGRSKSIIIIVTGQDSLLDRRNAETAGADGYLVKPVGPKVLDREIKQWFSNAKALPDQRLLIERKAYKMTRPTNT